MPPKEDIQLQSLSNPALNARDADAELLRANKADSRTEDARLASLSGKKMLFVAGDFMYKAFGDMIQNEFRTLRSHGVVVYGVFQAGKENGKYFSDCKNGDCLDYFSFCDIGAENGHDNIVAEVKTMGWDIEYCWSPHESTQPIMANVQSLLGLPGNAVSAYEKARDKYQTRVALAEAGLNSIKAVPIYGYDDAKKAATEIGFPIIIKPTVGMGSAGVYRANTEDELFCLVKRLLDEMDTDWMLNRSKVGKQAPILAETCVMPITFSDGKINEHDCEVLMWDGECVYSNIIDNFSTRPPFYAEIGSNCPTIQSTGQEEAMKKYAVQCVKALGFTRGGFHVECWATESGPLLIEINPRVGGGATVDSHIHCFGVNPMFQFAMSILDVPINPIRHEKAISAYGYLLPNAEITGHLQENVSFLEPAKASPHYVSSKYFAQPKSKVKGNDKYVADWLGEVCLEEMRSEDGELNIARFVKEMNAMLDQITVESIEETIPEDNQSSIDSDK